jgi:hypothetical protein
MTTDANAITLTRVCNKSHRDWGPLRALPHDQGGIGRHRCAGCAYEKGFEAGKRLEEFVTMSIATLPESQASAIRHRSPHAAFAAGYLDGVRYHYEWQGEEG